MPKTVENPTLGVRVPDKTRQELKFFCKKHGLIPGRVVEQAIKEKLRELEEIEKRRNLLALQQGALKKLWDNSEEDIYEL